MGELASAAPAAEPAAEPSAAPTGPVAVPTEPAPAPADAPVDAYVDAPAEPVDPDAPPVDATPAEIEMFDLEHDGVTHSIPAALRDSFMKNADYTQKTQTFAAEKQQIEEGLKGEFERIQRSKQFVDQMATSKMIEARLSQYENIDWAGWAAQDPVTAQKHQVISNDLKGQLSQVHQGINTQLSQQQNEGARAQQVAMVQAQAFITKAIPDWGPEVAQRLTKFGTEVLDIPTETLNQMNAFPWAVRALHMAEAQHRAIGSAQPKNQPKPTAHPVASPKGTAPGARSEDAMSTKEWMKFRQKQISKAQAGGKNIR